MDIKEKIRLKKIELEQLKSRISSRADFTSIPVNTNLNPTLPKTTKLQKEILEEVKKSNSAVSGSFAQKTLLSNSRNFKDIDIVTDKPSVLANRIKKRLGELVEIKKTQITTSPLGKFNIYRVYNKKGKLIADIDPIKKAEEGLISRYGYTKVDGLNVVNLRARLAAKIIQNERGKKARKIKNDLKLLGYRGASNTLSIPIKRRSPSFL